MAPPRYLPAVMLAVLAVTIAALAVYRVPLPAWPLAIAVAGLIACGMTFLASAGLDVARLLFRAGRHVRRMAR